MVQRVTGSSRVSRAGDAFRPNTLLYLSKQRSFSVRDWPSGQGGVSWVQGSAFSVPSSCPICYEILEEDGRCPGCRKPYEHDPVEAEASVLGSSLGSSLKFRMLARSCSMIARLGFSNVVEEGEGEGGDGLTGVICNVNENLTEIGRFDCSFGNMLSSSFPLFAEQRSLGLLWDTAAQERFRSLIPSYIRDSSVAVIAYHVASIREPNDVIIVLVGNKTDLVDKRQVSIEEGDNKAKEFEPLFRKIAAALPGLGTNSSTKQEDMVDVNLKSSGNSSQNPDQQGGGCAC
ncbi:Ras-related protein RABH1e [Hibiscus syriacus]|uniref:Ras-related protein RABH1e n=1 Tax=Hibiscus syriacus TaxID=106335 RepID=A0A6A2XFL9_HIBSY|nr:Ras-related protein RABH1e [Hibiscus syriacus]